eukprot:CAMPEP_0171350676 /NCGR_PEP_ID=MMETSP0878-20121228/36995_1 /TAXON_ID=67004 /ORGANISM="Thalassiosira weissflogii, Strain CCMP1336" /LENGTH=381 /DNA_ID=CAMNT_0011855667 /DNA_START=139 /DNA_END=1284 /DNA_ORIENTATION=+
MTPLFENSHDSGSSSAVQILLTFFLVWEALFHLGRMLIKCGLRNRPSWILDESLSLDSMNGGSNSNGAAAANNSINGTQVNIGPDANDHNDKISRLQDPNENRDSRTNTTTANLTPHQQARQTLIQQGPSYFVSLIHSLYVTYRGIHHISSLYDASDLEKVFITRTYFQGSHRPAHLEVAKTNIIFLSYLLYDLLHVIIQYPNLGKIDTIIHHLVFASCSAINGTYGVMPFPFGWLIVGEASTIFLNWRWFLRVSGRGGKRGDNVCSSGEVEQKRVLDTVNSLFAFSFFATRIILYSIGMIHLFGFSLEEVKQLQQLGGVPSSLLGMTCGCMFLGWGLNLLWGFKIWGMMVRGTQRKRKKSNYDREHSGRFNFGGSGKKRN